MSSLFFVSVGMLLDVRFMLANLALVALTVLALVALKFVCVALPTKLLGYPLRTAWLAGLSLCKSVNSRSFWPNADSMPDC